MEFHDNWIFKWIQEDCATPNRFLLSPYLSWLPAHNSTTVLQHAHTQRSHRFQFGRETEPRLVGKGGRRRILITRSINKPHGRNKRVSKLSALQTFVENSNFSYPSHSHCALFLVARAQDVAGIHPKLPCREFSQQSQVSHDVQSRGFGY